MVALGAEGIRVMVMEKSFELNWLPIFAGGLLIISGLKAGTEAINEATDICGVSRQAIACQPAIVPAADLPDPDHAPASPSSITATTVSTSTSTTVGAMPSTTVTGAAPH